MADAGTSSPRPGGRRDRPCGAYGYTQVPRRFRPTSSSLRPAILASDGWSGGGTNGSSPISYSRVEGLKGIGLVGAVLVLSEAGYTFPRVAGTSAGAIAATLIASILG